MGLNNTPMSERVHIGFFGRRNAGKSSVMNAVTGQDLAVVSDVKGTTKDPVYKSMEPLPIGPVVMIDTPGIDDEGELGKLRVKKSYQTLNKTDAAVLVIDAAAGVSGEDKKLLEKIKAKKIPYVVALNKKELAEEEDMERIKKELDSDGGWIIEVSAAAGDGICELKEKIAAAVHQEETENVLVRDLLHPSDIVVLVVPVDSAAPKGRLILPQQQVIRDILEAEAVSVVVKENGLKNILDQLKENPRMVITDSQVFKKVSKDTPADVPLTSFSILMARYKGNLEQAVRLNNSVTFSFVKPEISPDICFSIHTFNCEVLFGFPSPVISIASIVRFSLLIASIARAPLISSSSTRTPYAFIRISICHRNSSSSGTGYCSNRFKISYSVITSCLQ